MSTAASAERAVQVPAGQRRLDLRERGGLFRRGQVLDDDGRDRVRDRRRQRQVGEELRLAAGLDVGEELHDAVAEVVEVLGLEARGVDDGVDEVVLGQRTDVVDEGIHGDTQVDVVALVPEVRRQRRDRAPDERAQRGRRDDDAEVARHKRLVDREAAQQLVRDVVELLVREDLRVEAVVRVRVLERLLVEALVHQDPRAGEQHGQEQDHTGEAGHDHAEAERTAPRQTRGAELDLVVGRDRVVYRVRGRHGPSSKAGRASW